MRISSGKTRVYRFLKSMGNTFIRLIFEFVLFLAGGSGADVKVTRIRADKKGGYAHDNKGESGR